MVSTACSRHGWLSHQQLFPPDFLFSQSLVREGGMGVSLPHVTQWRVTFPYSGSKGNPAFLSQSQGPFPHAGAGVGTGVLDGLSSLLSLGSKLPWSHCLCLFQRIAHKRYSGQKDGVIPLGLAGAMPVSRWEIVSSFLAQTWGITHSGGVSG